MHALLLSSPSLDMTMTQEVQGPRHQRNNADFAICNMYDKFTICIMYFILQNLEFETTDNNAKCRHF